MLAYLVCFSYRKQKRHPIPRKLMSISGEELGSHLHSLQNTEGIKECAILSTCIRTEFYGVTESGGHPFKPFHTHFHNSYGMSVGDVDRLFITLEGKDALRQVFSVTSGLDSSIIGEKQIVHQFKAAYRDAKSFRATGKILNLIFQKSLNVSKKIRSKTGIDRGVSSSGSLAVKKLMEMYPSLDGKNILIIGAGQMGKIIGRNLKREGCDRITFCSRNEETARCLAENAGATHIPFSMLLRKIQDTDIVLSATSAPHRILSYHDLMKIMKKRYPHPLCVMDLAEPPDIDPRASTLPGVSYFSLHDIDRTARAKTADKAIAACEAWSILDKEVESFWPRIQNILAYQNLVSRAWGKTT